MVVTREQCSGVSQVSLQPENGIDLRLLMLYWVYYDLVEFHLFDPIMVEARQEVQAIIMTSANSENVLEMVKASGCHADNIITNVNVTTSETGRVFCTWRIGVWL